MGWESRFFSGGDIRALYNYGKKHPEAAEDSFRAEYRMNAAIFHFKKPYISFLDKITMGGGVGVSLHGSHRFATERLLFGMIETGVGFFPTLVRAIFFLDVKIKRDIILVSLESVLWPAMKNGWDW